MHGCERGQGAPARTAVSLPAGVSALAGCGIPSPYRPFDQASAVPPCECNIRADLLHIRRQTIVVDDIAKPRGIVARPEMMQPGGIVDRVSLFNEFVHIPGRSVDAPVAAAEIETVPGAYVAGRIFSDMAVMLLKRRPGVDDKRRFSALGVPHQHLTGLGAR